MDRCHTAWVSRRPDVEQLECFAAANLTDNDAIGTRAHRASNQVAQRDAGRSAKRYMIARAALQLDRILEDDDPLAGEEIGNFFEDGIGECRLARVCAAGDQNVRVREHGVP